MRYVFRLYKHQKISLLGVLLFCLYFAFAPGLRKLPVSSEYNEQRLLELLLFAVVCTLFVFTSSARRHLRNIFLSLSDVSKILLVLIPVLGLFASIHAICPRFALIEVSLFTLMFLAAICIASSRAQLDHVFDWIVAIALLVTGWIYLLDLMEYYLFALRADTPFLQKQIFSKFSNIRFFGQFQSWTLSLIVLPLLLWAKRSPYLTAFFLAPAMGWWLLLFVSGTRGTLLGCLIAFPATLLVFGRQAVPWFRWQGVTIAGGLIAYLLLFRFVPFLLETDVQNILSSDLFARDLTHSSGRWALWATAVAIIQAHPLLGIGPMQYAAGWHSIAAHPHNSLLQIAAEWGVPVATLMLVLFGRGMVTWIRDDRTLSHSETQKHLKPTLFACLLTAAVHSLFCGIIVMPVSQVMLVLITGWMFGFSIRQPSPDPSGKVSIFTLRVVFLCFSASIMSLLWFLPAQISQLEKSHADYVRDNPDQGYFRPRFWQQGYLIAYYPKSHRRGAATLPLK